ncbi:MAG TPA: VOC family protein [Chryseosolibacter sp.]
MKPLYITLLVIVSLACSKKQDNSMSPNDLPVALPADTAHLQAVRSTSQSMYTVFVTKRLAATKDFYTQWFGFQPVFESTWFVVLQMPGNANNLIAFIDEVHPSTPPSPRAFSGEGAFLTIDVADADMLFKTFEEAKAPFAYRLKTEAWGQKRFALLDPNGIWVDVVQQIEPEQGWWDKYLK